jgi:hypothetical protein
VQDGGTCRDERADLLTGGKVGGSGGGGDSSSSSSTTSTRSSSCQWWEGADGEGGEPLGRVERQGAGART